jgi:hypothetical protein
VNVTVGDGSVRFISARIDSGNPAVTPPASGSSLYGMLGALGTRQGGEAISLD